MRNAMLVIAVLFGMILGWFLLGVVDAQQDYPVVIFTPYEDVFTYTEPSLGSIRLQVLTAGEPVTLYTPYVGGDARWWAAINQERTEWVAIAINGYCPRERLGDVEPVK